MFFNQKLLETDSINYKYYYINMLSIRHIKGNESTVFVNLPNGDTDKISQILVEQNKKTENIYMINDTIKYNDKVLCTKTCTNKVFEITK